MRRLKRPLAFILVIAALAAVTVFPASAGVEPLLEELTVRLTAPQSVAAGQNLTAQAVVSNPEPVNCRAEWYINGSVIRRQELTATPEGTAIELTCSPAVDGNGRGAVELVVSARDESGRSRAIKTRAEYTAPVDAISGVLKGTKIVMADCGSKDGDISVCAAVSNPAVTTFTAEWAIDGRKVSENTVDMKPAGVYFSLDWALEKIPASGKVRVDLTLRWQGGSVTKSMEVIVGVTAQQALATVTHKYAGDYTLKWALEHDYDDNMKTAFVNAKGYSSATQWLIWVNLTYQRVNVFSGSKGNWKLEKTFLCGTGKPGSSTPVGEYTVWGFQKGWYHSTYWCEPVVRFRTGSGYAFHSRLWKPGHKELQDERIGFPISAGCVRMYDEDIQWLYDNITMDTKVVIH